MRLRKLPFDWIWPEQTWLLVINDALIYMSVDVVNSFKIASDISKLAVRGIRQESEKNDKHEIIFISIFSSKIP